MVTFAPEVPGTAPLVVRTKRSTRVLYGVLLAAGALEVVVAAAVVPLAIWLSAPALLVYVPAAALQLWLLGRVVREYQGLLGPQLAADHTGIWVRTGTGPHPEVAYLPWPAVDGVDAIRKGPVVRVMSRQGEALHGTRPHWRARLLRRRFGTSFVVDGRRSAEHPEQIAHRLRQLAEWAHS